VKAADISGTKKENTCKTKLMSLKRTVRRRKSRDLYRGMNEFQRG
jgi:hypothetical protein